MKISVGDVIQMDDGQIIKLEEIEPDGLFTARVKSFKTGDWTDYRIQGESIKLPLFLKQQKAKQLNPLDHPEPEAQSLRAQLKASKRRPRNE